jgi:hypothetical protein
MNQKAVGRISTPRTVSRLSLLMRRRPGDFQVDNENSEFSEHGDFDK